MKNKKGAQTARWAVYSLSVATRGIGFIFSVAMAFHFKKSKSIAAGVRRLCRRRFIAALSRLRDCGRPSAIHAARKEIKRLRAVFRLVRGEMGRGVYRRTLRALRRAADCLAAARDAQVRLRILETLSRRSQRRFPDIRRELRNVRRRELRRIRRRHGAAMARRILQKAWRRVRSLELKSDGWAALEPGLRRGYRRGRPARLHEWRKHVKDLAYYIPLLSLQDPSVACRRTHPLELLGKLLGQGHDLFLLQQFMAESGAGRLGEAAALRRLIAARQRRIRVAVLSRGARLYGPTPAFFCARLKVRWVAWRGGDSAK